MAAMAYFLGIDGGGTKTRMLLGDESRVLASTTVGGCNVVRLGIERARIALQQGIAEVCRVSALDVSQITAVCAGVAGAGREEVRQQVARVLHELLPASSIEVTGDMEIAHEAALAGAPGVIVIAGTGSIAFGRSAEGKTARAGGWGVAVSDEGSGHWIGMQAVAGILHAFDAGEPSELARRVFARWKLTTHDELVQRVNASPPPDYAPLAADVVAAYDAGDQAAQEILVRAGSELARLAQSVIGRLWPQRQPVEVAVLGGVFRSSEAVRKAFEVQLREAVPSALVTLCEADPAEGALARARKLRR